MMCEKRVWRTCGARVVVVVVVVVVVLVVVVKKAKYKW